MRQLLIILLAVSFYSLSAQSNNQIRGEINTDMGHLVLKYIGSTGLRDTFSIVPVLSDSTFVINEVLDGDYYLSYVPEEEERESAELVIPVTYFDKQVHWDSATVISLAGDSIPDLNVEIPFFMKEELTPLEKRPLSEIQLVSDLSGYPILGVAIYQLITTLDDDLAEINGGKVMDKTVEELVHYVYLDESNHASVNINRLGFPIRAVPIIDGYPTEHLVSEYYDWMTEAKKRGVDFNETGIRIYISLIEDVSINYSIIGNPLSIRQDDSVYPNPTSGLIQSKQAIQTVTNLSGKIVEFIRVDESTYDLSTLETGVYFVRLEGMDETIKLIKR